MLKIFRIIVVYFRKTIRKYRKRIRNRNATMSFFYLKKIPNEIKNIWLNRIKNILENIYNKRYG